MSKHKFGIYFDVWNPNYQYFGIGLVWTDEKYLYLSLFHFELTIGRTSR